MVTKSPKRIVLIDGEELARLMVVHEIGVRARIRYAIRYCQVSVRRASRYSGS